MKITMNYAHNNIMLFYLLDGWMCGEEVHQRACGRHMKIHVRVHHADEMKLKPTHIKIKK